jgi:hypothetical protein
MVAPGGPRGLALSRASAAPGATVSVATPTATGP